jgi:type II secretory ATPase GspE/PulE/Tfp pilus assembly ATPase PilB-like protein
MGITMPLPAISETKTQQELSNKLALIKQKGLIQQRKQEAQAMGINFVTLKGLPLPAAALSLLPISKAEKNQTIVYHKNKNLIKLACIDPKNPAIRKIADQLSKKYNTPVEISLTTPEDLAFGLKEYQYITKSQPQGAIIINKESIQSLTGEIKDFREIGDKIHQASLSEFLNLLFAAALKVNASDIHLQPEEAKVKIRLRIDGVLHHIFDLEPDKFQQVKKRIKLIAKLKINIEDKPQDGSFILNLPNNKIDLRISSLPSNYGESIVIRILNPEAVELDFAKLGFREEVSSLLWQEVKKPNGMIIACGPTGSGKTTTLYTILKELNNEQNQIITLEDPIEYKIPGIVQTQVNQERLNFAQDLKAIMRQDPDIVMVGEIRDLETADTAINAALTGHLVVSTIHTNDAAGAIPRFLALGVKPFLLTPSLNLIIGQRLVRKLCQHCKAPLELDPELLKKIKQELALLPDGISANLDLAKLTFYTGSGCSYCSGLGFKGRIGIYELLKMDDNIAAAIQKQEAAEFQMAQLARDQGMVTMVQDGLLKALDGITTVGEVFRVAD